MTGRVVYFARLICGFALLGACASCHRQSNTTTAARPTAPPSMLAVMPTPPHTFKASGVQFDYPGDWQIVKGKTAVLCIVAPGTDRDIANRPTLNLDVPKLPWHIPGMITPGMVCSGYIDDLRKNQIPDAVIKEQKTLTISGETAKKLVSCGHCRNKTLTDVAIIVVHSDRVYILSADSDDQGCDCASKAVDTAVASMKWTK